MAIKTKDFVWGALAGGIIGSVAAMLLTPKSGRELRSDLGECLTKAADTAAGWGEKIGDTAVVTAKQTADSFKGGIKFWNRGHENDELAAISANRGDSAGAADGTAAAIDNSSDKLESEEIFNNL